MKLTPEEYIDWYEAHRDRYTVTIERHGIRALVRYHPPELHVARQIVTAGGDTDSLLSHYTNAVHFAFGISVEGKERGSFLVERGGVREYGQRVYQNTFMRNEDIFLLRGADTVKCAGYHFDRTYGVGGEDVFIAGFPRVVLGRKVKDFHLIVRDIAPELGTIDIPVRKLMARTRKLRS
jgi:hypothetical protein